MHIVNLYNREIGYSVSGMCQYWNKNYKTNRMSVYLRNICAKLCFLFDIFFFMVSQSLRSTKIDWEPSRTKSNKVFPPASFLQRYIYTFWVVVSSHSFFFCSTYSWSLYSMQTYGVDYRIAMVHIYDLISTTVASLFKFQTQKTRFYLPINIWRDSFYRML